MSARPLTHEEVSGQFSYDESTGKLLRKVRFGRQSAGREPSTRLASNGALMVSFYERKNICVHVVAWLLAGRSLGNRGFLRHINGDATDNRIANLRLASEPREISFEFVSSLVSYAPESGVLTFRKKIGRNAAGDVVSSRTSAGYLVACLDGSALLAHRIAFSLHLGRLLRTDEHIDHINGCRDDNRLANLRIASQMVNMQNSHTRNGKPIAGAQYDPTRGSWKARVKANGKEHFIGRFKTAEEARAAYIAAKATLHAPNVVAGTIAALPPLRSDA